VSQDVKRWLGLFGILAVATAIVVCPLLRPPPIVAAYNRIQVGMTVQEAVAIMGEPTGGDCESSCIFVWNRDGYRVVVSFPQEPPARITSKEIERR
jgi:hypothetical protein